MMIDIIVKVWFILKEFLPYCFAVKTLFYVTRCTINNFRIIKSYGAVSSMPELCASLGYVINLSGKKGAGKTTTAAGIINYLVMYVINKMIREMEQIRIALKEIDFFSLEYKFMEELRKCKNDHKLAIKNIVSSYSFNTFYTDNLQIFSKYEMLRKYLKRFWIVNFRQNYILSKTSFFTPITNENAKMLDPSSLELRNIKLVNNYQLDIANIIFDDEKSLADGNVHSNNKEVKLSGKKEQRALLRNAYEGLCFEVTTKQYDEDEIKLERKQIDASLNIRSRKEINYSLIIPRVLKFIYSIMLLPRKFVYMFHNYDLKMDRFKKSCTWLRSFENFIDNTENIIKSQGYIIVYVRSYFDPDDVGKQNPDLYEKLKLVFEKELCYGSVDTHEWRALANDYDKYRNNSLDKKTSFFDDESKVDIWNKSLNK